jgi:glucokinase
MCQDLIAKIHDISADEFISIYYLVDVYISVKREKERKKVSETDMRISSSSMNGSPVINRICSSSQHRRFYLHLLTSHALILDRQ